MKKSEEWDRLNNLKKALDDIKEIAIPFHIIVHCIFPLRDWLNDVLKTGEKMNKEERKKWQEYLERREEALKSCLRETNLKKVNLKEEIRRVQELKEKNKEEDSREE